MAYISAA